MKYSEMTYQYYKNENLIAYFKNRYDIQGDNIENVAKIIFHQVAEGVLYLH